MSWGIAESIEKYDEDTKKKVLWGADIASLYDQETERELAKEVENRIEEVLSDDAALLEIRQFLNNFHENERAWDESTCEAAASEGNLTCLKYLHENGCPWDESACAAAAFWDPLECLKYLHENECPWNERTCEAAASGANLECLKYAHENGSPWDEETCAAAAEGANLECLKYAHENGCPMFGDDRYYEIMQLYENGQIYGDGAAPHRDAVRSYLESIRGPIGCPIEFVMAKLDEVATNIPEQTYIEMSRALMRARRMRPNQ